MSVPLLLDEHVEHEVYYRLESDGYQVEHVALHDTLERGDSDRTLAEYSLEHGALIITYDDDFAQHHDESDYWGVLFFSDDDWSANEVAETVHRIVELYDESTLKGINLVGREWL
jgi:predicted nuclease of predicted toxin-antitoxin system